MHLLLRLTILFSLRANEMNGNETRPLGLKGEIEIVLLSTGNYFLLSSFLYSF